MNRSPGICGALSWRSHYKVSRTHRAPPLLNVAGQLVRIWRNEDHSDFFHLCRWYAERHGIRTACGLSIALSWHFPGICLGTSEALIDRLRCDQRLDLAGQLDRWQEIESYSVFLSLMEVFRYAVDVDRVAKRALDGADAALERLVPQPKLRIWVKERHIDNMRIALEDCDDCAVILRYSSRSARSGVGHAYLLVFRSELQRFEFLDTTPGRGLYRFDSREELLDALATHFEACRSTAIRGKNWIFDYYNLTEPGELKGGPRLSTDD